MKIVWNEQKRRSNLEKHKCDFADVLNFDWEHATFIDDVRKDYGERRILAFGLFEGRLHIVAFTPRGGEVRIFSFRKANRKEVMRHGKS